MDQLIKKIKLSRLDKNEQLFVKEFFKFKLIDNIYYDNSSEIMIKIDVLKKCICSSNIFYIYFLTNGSNNEIYDYCKYMNFLIKMIKKYTEFDINTFSRDYV